MHTSDEFTVLVTAVSWEDRFTRGFDRIMGRHKIKNVILLRYQEWEYLTEDAMRYALDVCGERGIGVRPVSLSHERPEETRLGLRSEIDKSCQTGGAALVDITTMPREAIWTTFLFLSSLVARVVYVYHEPGSYDRDWLSRDPGRPRLVLQMSGEARLGRPTVLVVTTGFDLSRTIQLMRTFEPRLTLLALQKGDQFGNRDQNLMPHRGLAAQAGPEFQYHHSCESFYIDAYSHDRGQAAIETKLKSHLDRSNLVMSSLGPKLTAIALYQIHRRYPKTALVYAPSMEYNLHYSAGIGNTIMGML